MQVKILGSAAGGGFPQWNCACPNCSGVRNGHFEGKPRLQTQLAVSGDGATWFLLGASPDLRAQIESAPDLHPRNGFRHSPIAGAILASADLDHVLGLLLLRELQPLRVYATESVLHQLRDENRMFAMLNRIPEQVRWSVIRAEEQIALQTVEGTSLGIDCKSVALSSRLPAYATGSANSNDAVIGLILSNNSGRKLGFFPQLPCLTPELHALFASLDFLLMDGTFWSDDELIRLQGTGQRARDMGHIPVGGREGTLEQLKALAKPRKMYIHINNTNPMLNEAGPEYRQVRDAGWELAGDGCQLTL